MLRILRALAQSDRWSQLDQALTSAFGRLRGDMRTLYSWIKYFREKELQNDERNEKVAHEMGEQQAAIRAIQAQIMLIREDLQRMREMQQAGSQNYAQNQVRISPFADQVRTKSGLKSGPGKTGVFEKKMLAITRPARKDYVMHKIAELAAKGRHTTKQVENIIVGEKMLCGRTAFYDYLKELRIRGEIGGLQRQLAQDSNSDDE